MYVKYKMGGSFVKTPCLKLKMPSCMWNIFFNEFRQNVSQTSKAEPYMQYITYLAVPHEKS